MYIYIHIYIYIINIVIYRCIDVQDGGRVGLKRVALPGFNTGAFAPGVPVQPIVQRFPYKFMSHSCHFGVQFGL